VRLRDLLFVALIVCCGAAHAERRVIGDWALDVGDSWTEALTANDSAASFGYYCTGGSCSFYLDLHTSCGVDGTRTPMLVNTELGSASVMATCVNLAVGGTTRHVNVLRNEDMLAAIGKGSTIGFSVPMQGGQFKLVQFSLNGAAAATNGATSSMEQLARSRARQPRDFAI
jgi:hypothetical protein